MTQTGKEKETKGLFQAVGSFLERVVSLSRYVGFALLGGMAGLVTLGTILRYFFNRPFIFTEEIIQVMMVSLSTLAVAYVFQAGAHISVDLVTRNLPSNVQGWLERWRELLTIGLLAILIPEFYTQLGICLSVDRRFESISSWPMWPVRLIALIGLALAILYLIKMFIAGLWRLGSHTSDRR